MQNRLRANNLVTFSHLVIVFVYTVLSILYLNVKSLSPLTQVRVLSAYYFLSGLADIFIALMVWFVLDDECAPAAILFSHGDFSYAVLDVIRAPRESLNKTSVEEEEEEELTSVRQGAESIYSMGSFISDRMIALFFKEVRDPDK